MTKLLRSTPIVLVLLFGAMQAQTTGDIWLNPTLAHPLGCDEFGRDIGLVFLISIGRSLASGIILAGVSIFLAVAAAIAVALMRLRAASLLLQLAIQVIESIPIFVWVLVAFAAFRGASAFVVGAAFVIAVLPATTNIIAGEFRRIDREPYLDAARLLGVSPIKRLLNHILPNAAGVLTPLFIQMLGIALAIKGAVGLLGFSNRTDYDLGMILLRGRENLVAHPLLMVSAVLVIALIYLYLDWMKESFLQRGKRKVAFTQAEAMLQ